MAKSDYLEVEFIEHIFRTNVIAVKPTILGIALFTAAPSDSGGGTELTGVGGYLRIDEPPLDANWDAVGGGTDGKTANTNIITFPVPTANWGSVTHFGIFDALTTGNLLYWGALTDPKTVNDGDPAPTFPAGSLTITES
jgi:hypothetical protein